jgi:hypothetical protein
MTNNLDFVILELKFVDCKKSKKYIIRELNPGLNDGNVEFYH